MYRWAYGLLFFAVSALCETSLYEKISIPQVSSLQPSSGTFSEKKLYGLSKPMVDYEPHTIYLDETLSSRDQALVADTLYLQAVMLSSIGILALMPESVTNWSEAKLKDKSLWTRWKENVSSGPVWDQDDWVINYIGHPVSGAWYYTMARNDGFSEGESAFFSFLMSTFFWEYGYEAFAEVPSTQDLIITPLIGSFLGEGMMVLQNKLDKRQGILLGSKTLGNISYFLIDPLGNIAKGIHSLLIELGFDAKVSMQIRTYPRAQGMPEFTFMTPVEYSMLYGGREYGFVISIY